MSMVNGESISRSKRKRSNGHQHKDEGKVLSIPYSSKERMKTKSTTLAFIHRTFEGRFNPNFWPLPSSPYLTLLANSLL